MIFSNHSQLYKEQDLKGYSLNSNVRVYLNFGYQLYTVSGDPFLRVTQTYVCVCVCAQGILNGSTYYPCVYLRVLNPLLLLQKDFNVDHKKECSSFHLFRRPSIFVTFSFWLNRAAEGYANRSISTTYKSVALKSCFVVVVGI